MLDGNAIAGLLEEVFRTDMTNARGTCAACGAEEPMGAIHVFRGAGIVLRCPHCTNVLVKIVKAKSRVWIAYPGVGALEITLESHHSSYDAGGNT